jgi:phosphoribosylaminoimidazolecarboxamide formyltransferase/IMP cyclohydrolase
MLFCILQEERRFYKNLGIPVTAVEDVTYPSILGGRKTLHPKVFGGILNRQDNESDVQQMKNLTFHRSI